MNKDNNIDELFSDQMEDVIKNEIKKKRNKLNLKLITISIVSTLIIIIVGVVALNFASDKYIENSYAKEQQKLELENIIMNPNEYIGKERCMEIGYFKFESTYDYAKRIVKFKEQQKLISTNKQVDFGNLYRILLHEPPHLPKNNNP